jgi:hypothetical protein
MNSVAQHFTMSPTLSSAIDRWIDSQPEPRPSRPEAIRRLLVLGLAQPEDNG